jgi:hypothetical protein
VEFAVAFKAITKAYEDNNALRSTKIEAFLLKEATIAGVLEVRSKRVAKNPNKWAKHLAPWFNERCKTARTRYRKAVK